MFRLFFFFCSRVYNFTKIHFSVLTFFDILARCTLFRTKFSTSITAIFRSFEQNLLYFT